LQLGDVVTGIDEVLGQQASQAVLGIKEQCVQGGWRQGSAPEDSHKALTISGATNGGPFGVGSNPHQDTGSASADSGN
jgi:hypothetical protein